MSAAALHYRGDGLGLGFGEAGAGSAHDTGEAASQFADAVGFMEQHGFAGDEFFADTKCGGSCKQVVGGVLLRDAATGHERNIRKRPPKRPDVAIRANQRTRKELHEIRAGFPAQQNLCRGHRSGHHDDIRILGDKFHGGEVEGGAANELNASIDAAASGVDVKNGSSTENDAGHMLDDISNHLDRARNGHGDFDEGNATMRNFFDREARIFRG